MDRYTVIRGSFHVVGYQPDGDSMRFGADDVNDWDSVGNVNSNARGHTQLRFQGIDTLETHAGGSHQPLDLAVQARDRLLALVGITGVRYDNLNRELEVTAANDQTRGTVLAKGVANRRPISFVFAGDHFPQVPSGSTADVPANYITSNSVNVTLLDEGHAYPLFYRELDEAVRANMAAVAQARYNGWTGLWAYDWSEGVEAADLGELEDFYAVFPKLFRRMVNHMRDGGSSSRFVQALRDGNAGENDRLHLAADPATTLRFTDVLQQVSNRRWLGMTQRPWNIIIH